MEREGDTEDRKTTSIGVIRLRKGCNSPTEVDVEEDDGGSDFLRQHCHNFPLHSP